MKRISLLLIVIIALIGCGNSKEYKMSLIDVSDDMMDNAEEVEIILSSYVDVWSYSIKSGGAIPVDEIVSVTEFSESEVEDIFEVNEIGNIPNDFSTNIYSLNDYYEKEGILEDIENANNKAKEEISELNDPPKDLKEAYNELLDMYEYTKEYSEMAVNPNDSFDSFTKKESELSDDITSKRNRIEVLVPNE